MIEALPNLARRIGCAMLAVTNRVKAKLGLNGKAFREKRYGFS
jgi:hypothetical protein